MDSKNFLLALTVGLLGTYAHAQAEDVVIANLSSANITVLDKISLSRLPIHKNQSCLAYYQRGKHVRTECPDFQGYTNYEKHFDYGFDKNSPWCAVQLTEAKERVAKEAPGLWGMMTGSLLESDIKLASGNRLTVSADGIQISEDRLKLSVQTPDGSESLAVSCSSADAGAADFNMSLAGLLRIQDLQEKPVTQPSDDPSLSGGLSWLKGATFNVSNMILFMNRSLNPIGNVTRDYLYQTGSVSLQSDEGIKTVAGKAFDPNSPWCSLTMSGTNSARLHASDYLMPGLALRVAGNSTATENGFEVNLSGERNGYKIALKCNGLTSSSDYNALMSRFLKADSAQIQKEAADAAAQKAEKEKQAQEQELAALGPKAAPDMAISELAVGDSIRIVGEALLIETDKRGYMGSIFQNGDRVGVADKSLGIYSLENKTLDPKQPYCLVAANQYRSRPLSQRVPLSAGIYQVSDSKDFLLGSRMITIKAKNPTTDEGVSEAIVICFHSKTVADLQTSIQPSIEVYHKAAQLAPSAPSAPSTASAPTSDQTVSDPAQSSASSAN